MKNSRYPNWIFTVISSILVGVSYHPLSLGFLAYIGFIPLIHVWLQNNYKKNFVHGYVFGFLYNLLSNYWIGANSGAEFIVVISSLFFAVCYLALFWGLAGLLIGLFKNKDFKYYLPFLVVSLEWFRSFGPLGFDWGILALTQTNYLPFLQLNDILGPYFSSFFIIYINCSIYQVLIENKYGLKHALKLCLIILIFFIYGNFKLNNNYNEKESLRVAVIQPNLDPNEKWNRKTRESNIGIIDSLHNLAINLSPEIILFPETAYPTYLTLDIRVRNKIQDKVNNSKIPILVGTVDRVFDEQGKKLYFNSALFMTPGGKYEIYSKIHLVPFAEYDLLPKFLHPLVNLNLNIDRGVFIGGNNYKIFEWKNIKFANLICYESSFARYSRKFTNQGAQILMIQANDGWLGTSSGPYQHFSSAILRAIENRVPVVRSGNTGISGVILPTGEVKQYKEIQSQSVFIEEIPINPHRSFYSRNGDFFPLICFVIFLFLGPVRCSKN